MQACPRCGVEPSEHVALPTVSQWDGTVSHHSQGLWASPMSWAALATQVHVHPVLGPRQLCLAAGVMHVGPAVASVKDCFSL